MLAGDDFVYPPFNNPQSSDDVDFSWNHIHNHDMTAIVAVLCEDGVVFGSDGCAIQGLPSNTSRLTVRYTVESKVEIIDDRILCAISGHGNIGQQFIDVLRDLSVCMPKDSFKAVRKIVREFSETMDSMRPGAFDALKPDICAFVAIPTNEDIALLEFNKGGFLPTVKSADNWHGSFGLWAHIPDLILRIMKKAFFQYSRPTLQEGIFSVSMALKLTCDLAPHHVTGPISIATLSHDNNENVIANRLKKNEIEAEMQHVESALSHFGKYLKNNANF